MADERHEYEALIPIDDPVMSRTAYLPGQPVHAQVVEDWGLKVGQAGDEGAQVLSLRPQQMARPAANASQQDWLRYRAGQPGANVAELELLGRNALRDMDAPEQTTDEATDAERDDEADEADQEKE